MNYKIAISILIFFLSGLFCIAQDYQLPKYKSFYDLRDLWKDSITQNQKEYWENGNLKIEYKDIEGSYIKLKKMYYENGILKMEAEVFQRYVSDTMYIENELGDLKVVPYIGYEDVFEGIYFEYFDKRYPYRDSTLTKGQFNYNKPIGTWQFYNGKYYTFLNFNSDGYLDGEYLECYSNNKNHIHLKGQFKSIYKTDEENIEYLKSIRYGEWNLFYNGTIEYTAVYK